MKLTLNGDQKSITTKEKSLTLDIVINKLGLNPKIIVVECNGLIINKQLWGSQTVKDGDVLEIVTIVGGGS